MGRRRCPSCRGSTLIELMIAMGLSVLIVGGMALVLQTQERAYQAQGAAREELQQLVLLFRGVVSHQSLSTPALSGRRSRSAEAVRYPSDLHPTRGPDTGFQAAPHTADRTAAMRSVVVSVLPALSHHPFLASSQWNSAIVGFRRALLTMQIR